MFVFLLYLISLYHSSKYRRTKNNNTSEKADFKNIRDRLQKMNITLNAIIPVLKLEPESWAASALRVARGALCIVRSPARIWMRKSARVLTDRQTGRQLISCYITVHTVERPGLYRVWVDPLPVPVIIIMYPNICNSFLGVWNMYNFDEDGEKSKLS